MRWIIFVTNILLYLSLICEDLKRPKKKKDCFQRTFVGEYNKNNAYCCYFHFIKSGWEIEKCSVHFKEEIDNDAVKSTMKFLKDINTQNDFDDKVTITSFDCKNFFIQYKKIFLFLYIFFIII